MTTASALTHLESALARLVHASWQAAVLGLVVFVGVWALRGRLEARWRFGLWLVVLARLALPVAPPAPWSLFQLAPATLRGTTMVRPMVEPFPSLERGNSVTVTEPVAPDLAAPVVVPPFAAPGEPSRESLNPAFLSMSQWLTAVWLAGVLLLMARHGWLIVRLRRQRRTWRDVSEPAVVDAFRRCREELGVTRTVRLLMTPDGCGPATCGTVRPCILLPERLLLLMPAVELRLVLLHELTHVRRRDILLDRFAGLLVAIHWFNPIAWLALACLRRERETACDEAVLGRLSESESILYGHSLLHVAERLSAPTQLPGLVGVFGKDRSLVRRIHVIANYRKPTAAAKARGAFLLLVLAAFGLTDAATAPVRSTYTDQATPAAQGENAKALAVTGVCNDDDGKPLAGVQVALYRQDHLALKTERLNGETTDNDGHFRFRDRPPPPDEKPPWEWAYTLAITKPGLGSIIVTQVGRNPKVSPHFSAGGTAENPLQFKMRPATVIRGRVTDLSGQPVAGAQVWAQPSAVTQGLDRRPNVPQFSSNNWIAGPIEGVHSARTDVDGRYAISDMSTYSVEEVAPNADARGPDVILGCFIDVIHPNYSREQPRFWSIAGPIDIVLRPAGAIEGRVVDQVTGQPAANVAVYAQGTKDTIGGSARRGHTDAAGKYRLLSLPTGKFNVWADARDRTCVAIDSIPVEAGTTRAAADITLVEGSWIEGRLIEANTGLPIGWSWSRSMLNGRTKERPLRVAAHGAGRPKSGTADQACEVDDQGRFRLHVAPGLNYPFIQDETYWRRTQRREYFERGIEVKASEVVSLEFRILPTEPIPDPDPTPIRLRVPVAAERAAAARIHQLGGWYSVDADNHVIEINMAYHETLSMRSADNRRTDTDEALRTMSTFPRLKRLFLTGRQATDDGLRSLAQLRDLETLFIWDAQEITDAGIAHLAGLTKLTNLHFNDGQLGDASLAVFGRLPELRYLSLSGNAFSDDGLKYLAALKQFRSLWIGMNRPPITDAGRRHLTGRGELKELDLQDTSRGMMLHRLQQQWPGLKLSAGRGSGPSTSSP